METPKYTLFFSENSKQVWIIIFFALLMTGSIFGTIILLAKDLSENELLAVVMAEIFGIMALLFFLGKTWLSAPVEITIIPEGLAVKFLKSNPLYSLKENPVRFETIEKYTISTYKGKKFVSMRIAGLGGVTIGSDGTAQSEAQLMSFSKAFKLSVEGFNQTVTENSAKTGSKPISEYDLYQTIAMKIIAGFAIVMAVGYTIGMLYTGRSITTFDGWIALYGLALFLGYRVFLYQKK